MAPPTMHFCAHRAVIAPARLGKSSCLPIQRTPLSPRALSPAALRCALLLQICMRAMIAPTRLEASSCRLVTAHKLKPRALRTC